MKILKTTLSSLAASLLILGLLTQITYAQEAVPDGTLDLMFNVNASTNNIVNGIAVQPDGKIVIAGAFTMVNGEPRNRIARLNPNGTLDPDFTLVNLNDNVFAIALQTDGKILLGGTFTEVSIAGESATIMRNHIVRLNTNGTLDEDFNPNVVNEADDANVSALALQMIDGNEHILIGGDFTTIGTDPVTTTRNSIARLNPNGSVDMSFVPPNPNAQVLSIDIDSNNRVFIAGSFTAVNDGTNDITRNNIARLDVNGGLDSTFDSPALTFLGSDGFVFSLVVQSDDKPLIGGLISNVGGVTRGGIVRFDTSGSVDDDFNVPLLAGELFREIRSIALQADGKILLGGDFLDIGGSNVLSNLARVNPDGSLDTSFSSSATGTGADVAAIVIQPLDNNIIIGGDFVSVNGEPRANIARLANTIPRPEIGFSNTTQNQQEGNTNDDPTIFTFQVTNVLPEGAIDVASSVSYAVSGSGANPANAEDFVGGEFPTGTLNFANSNSNETITIEIARDADIEENETFTITLSNQNPNTTTLTTATAQGTILDDDEEDDILCLPIPANNGNFAVICL